MMNRRQFVTTGAAGAALFGRVREARAAAYDLITKGGRVIDPSMWLDAVRDVAIVRGKIAAGAGELHDINSANVALAQGAIAGNRDVVVGVKARLSNNVAGANDLEALRRAQEAAAPFNLPVMIHVGQNYSPLRSILALLKRGDIVTHIYAPGMNGSLDAKGVLIPAVMGARRHTILS